jgi:ABC-type Fe3+-siderophore transport system permease subunit
MDTEVTIGILKAAGALIGGALVAGLLANYRDPGGKLTRAGVAVLSGISLSALGGVITSVIETQKDRTSSREQAIAQSTGSLLRELSRSIQPIYELKITYWMELPQENKIVAAC